MKDLLETTSSLAEDMGQKQMEQQQLIILMILVQVASIGGAYVAGIYQEHVGFKRALMASLVLMLAAVVWMMFNQTLTGYFIIASLAGFALTGVQVTSPQRGKVPNFTLFNRWQGAHHPSSAQLSMAYWQAVWPCHSSGMVWISCWLSRPVSAQVSCL